MTGRRHLAGARIWTADAARPWARSVTIDGGRIVALDASPAPHADRIDLDGCTITPGLVDGHVHFLMGGLALEDLDLSEVRSRRAFEDAIAARHHALPEGEWLIARGWTESNWGGTLPDKSWLASAGTRPTVCHRMDLHASVVNDAALARCTLVPGVDGVRTDAGGAPTGLMVEAAAWTIVNPSLPTPGVVTRRKALTAAQRHAHAMGLTAVGTMEYTRDLEEVYAAERDHLTIRCRVTLLDRGWPIDCTPGARFPSCPHLGVNGYKAFLDGTLGSRTARMKTPYADADHSGEWLELAASGDLDQWACAVVNAGLSPVVHAIGDAAVARALSLAEMIDARGSGRGPRVRIEHAQHVDPVDVPRFRGRLVGVQPAHRAEDGRIARARVGPNRLDRVFPLRALQDAGATLIVGTDWPVVPLDPRPGFRAAVTGLTRDGDRFQPASSLTIEEVLAGATRHAARGLGLPGGVLTPGGPADLTVFDGDPFEHDWARSLGPAVQATLVDGNVVHGSLS